MKTLWLIPFLLCLTASAQIGADMSNTEPSAAPAISLDASCTGSASLVYGLQCSSAMTVTAGDTIVCNASGFDFAAWSSFITDNLNGTYDAVMQGPHPNSANSGYLVAIFQNSAGGSITPSLVNYDPFYSGISCKAFKNTRTTFALDGGSVNQTNVQSSAAANPTSGTAAAPTNNNELVSGVVIMPTFQTVTDAVGWLPSGILTGIGVAGAEPLYDHYQIQTTATAVNSPFTSASAKYVDTQLAILNVANPAGYRSLTGVFGIPAISKTNGVTVTAADLDGSTTTLTSIPPTSGTGWTLNSGTGGTYNTGINPTGTKTIFVQGVTHSFGDAGTSITIGAADTTTNWIWSGYGVNSGQPYWLSFFYRVGSTGISNGQSCDTVQPTNFATDTAMLFQVNYATGTNLGFKLEYGAGTSGTSSFAWGGALDTDYFIQLHGAGVNERNNQVLIYSKSGTWSLANTFNSDVLCTASAQGASCSTPSATATTTGTASSGSAALTVASGTGIVVGQVILGTGIADPSQSGDAWTTVTAVSGTSVTLSQNTLSALSGTTVNFYAAPPSIRTATSGTATSGSTALTVVAPTYSSITVGDLVGGVGIQEGTIVAAVSGTSVTLSLPTTAALAAGTGVTFWTPTNGLGFNFGKYSSCSIASAISFSGWVFDPYNDWGAFAPN